MNTWAERKKWLLDYIAKEASGIDILNSDFVVDYCEANEVKAAAQWFGAPKCKTLGADLGRLFREGYLTRGRVGINDGLSGQGFPKWVYNYRLRKFKWLST